MAPLSGDDPFAAVVGQPGAVALLRGALTRTVHAYLFVGPQGGGSRLAARVFAGELFARGSGDDAEGAARHRRLALLEAHPDLDVVEREGAAISRDQARGIVERAARSPVEAPVKVLLLTELHLVLDAAPILLKTIEEPPATTVFVILADEVPPELVTIASRCLVVRFAPLAPAVVLAQLQAEGVDAEAAERAAEAAGGDLDRARLLASDPGLAERMATWRDLPQRLDGTGAAVAAAVRDVLGQLEASLAPVDAKHQGELAVLAERDQRFGLSAAGQRRVEARHKRERRRLRRDDLRSGLGVLSRAYRDELVAATGTTTTGHEAGRPGPPALVFERFAAIQAAVEALERNPNEALLLQALFCRLAPLTGGPGTVSGRGAASPTRSPRRAR